MPAALLALVLLVFASAAIAHITLASWKSTLRVDADTEASNVLGSAINIVDALATGRHDSGQIRTPEDACVALHNHAPSDCSAPPTDWTAWMTLPGNPDPCGTRVLEGCWRARFTTTPITVDLEGQIQQSLTAWNVELQAAARCDLLPTASRPAEEACEVTTDPTDPAVLTYEPVPLPLYASIVGNPLLTQEMIDAADDAGVVFGLHAPAADTPVTLIGTYGGLFINRSGGLDLCGSLLARGQECSEEPLEVVTLEDVNVGDGACDLRTRRCCHGSAGRGGQRQRPGLRHERKRSSGLMPATASSPLSTRTIVRPSQPDYSAFWWTYINYPARNDGLLGSAVDRWISANWMGTPLPGDPGTAQGRQRLRDELDAVAVAEGGIDLSALNAADVSLDVSYIKATTLDDYPRRHDRPVVVSPSDGSSIRITGNIPAPPDKPLLIVSGCHIIIDGPCIFGAVNPADPDSAPQACDGSALDQAVYDETLKRHAPVTLTNVIIVAAGGLWAADLEPVGGLECDYEAPTLTIRGSVITGHAGVTSRLHNCDGDDEATDKLGREQPVAGYDRTGRLPDDTTAWASADLPWWPGREDGTWRRR